MTTRAAWAALLLAATVSCSGKDGTPGKDGAPGQNGSPGNPGTPGAPGTSTGTVRGAVLDGGGQPIAGASVIFTPGDFAATTAADGSYGMSLPVGVYAAAASAAGFGSGAAAGISILAGQLARQDFSLTATPPEVLARAGTEVFQAGFGARVQLDATGSTAPTGATYSWARISGPPATLSDASAAQPTFTTLTLEELETAGLFAAPERFGIVGVSAADALRLTYVFEVAVAAGDAASTARVSIQSIPPQPGLPVSGVGALAAVATRSAASYGWTCASVQGATETPCAAGVLTGAGGRAATFKPTAAGSYVLRETVGGGALSFTVATYVGPRPIAGSSTCATCHSGSLTASDGRTLTEKYGPWVVTPHATFFQRAIEGGLPVPYEQSCIRCHTTGYNPEAANGGFDDEARAAGWTFPTPAPGNLDALRRQSEQLYSLAAVGCESCHGPGSAHAGAGGDPARIARGFSADTCAQCHAKEPYESQGLQWFNSRHSRFTTGAVPIGGDPALQDGCVICHTARGYVGWIRSGSTGQVAGSSDLAEPQTCVACHDPHGEAADPSGQPTFRQLRVYDDVTALSGIGARGVGGAATCLKCHNRQQRFSLAGQLAPHFSAQGDVLLAKGAEVFESPPSAPYPTSAHGSVPRLCVGCHMAATPPAGAPGHNEVGGHSVAMASGALEHVEACSGCHPGLSRFNRTAYGDYDGDGDLEGVQDETSGLLALVANALDARAATLWPAETGGAALVVSENGFLRILRRSDLTPAFDAGLIPSATPQQRDFLRAAWNLFLVCGSRPGPDGRSSRAAAAAVHNTAFTVSVLQRTYQALAGAPVPGAVLR